MANIVRLPYSNTAGNTPSSLGNGVIGVNQADGKLFYRNAIWIGSQSGGVSMAGYLDEFRWTVGTARGFTGSTITVPTAAYPDY